MKNKKLIPKKEVKIQKITTVVHAATFSWTQKAKGKVSGEKVDYIRKIKNRAMKIKYTCCVTAHGIKPVLDKWMLIAWEFF